jgi:hypothetical protein
MRVEEGICPCRRRGRWRRSADAAVEAQAQVDGRGSAPYGPEIHGGVGLSVEDGGSGGVVSPRSQEWRGRSEVARGGGSSVEKACSTRTEEWRRRAPPSTKTKAEAGRCCTDTLVLRRHALRRRREARSLRAQVQNHAVDGDAEDAFGEDQRRRGRS